MTEPAPHERHDNTGRLEPLLDIEGIANRLGVTERHIRRLVAERRIPYVKWGHLLRFDPNDIDEWLATMRRAPLQPAAGALRHRRDG
jgi:excisionase family DNA binding protein